MWHQLNQTSSARDLLDCIVRFAQQETNPVLTILGNEAPHELHHYPPKGVTFGNGLWRAFYHSHETPVMDPAEHGHFHFFARFADASDEWTHIAGLAVDRFGQPIEWFSANQWVVNDVWRPAEYLEKHLPSPISQPGSSLVCNWMGAMLGAYRDEINKLLVERDHFVRQRAENSDQSDVLADRSLWRLSRQEIQLQSKLATALAA